VSYRASPAPDDPIQGLGSAIQSLTGRAAKRVEIERFGRYLKLPVEWNRTHRLTAARTAEGIVRGLFLDSLLFLAHLPSGMIRVADLGTGPGIPGIPLRIVRDDVSLTLVESRRKRISFLGALKRTLDLNDLVVLEGRAEQLVAEPRDLAGAFDVVVARAVGISLLSTALLYLRPGGVFVAGGSPGGIDANEHRSQSVTVKTVMFDKLGVERTFLVAYKAT
jgi:16S rRNA (guanine527-N7)-methyltransferase